MCCHSQEDAFSQYFGIVCKVLCGFGVMAAFWIRVVLEYCFKGLSGLRRSACLLYIPACTYIVLSWPADDDLSQRWTFGFTYREMDVHIFSINVLFCQMVHQLSNIAIPAFYILLLKTLELSSPMSSVNCIHLCLPLSRTRWGSGTRGAAVGLRYHG